MTRSLLETLPAAAPLRTGVRGTLLAAAGIVGLGLGSFVLWSVTVPISRGAVAHGRVAVEGQRKAVQHLEGGIVGEILVRDGDRVQAGQVLVRMDPARSRIAEGLLSDQAGMARALLVRLEAEQAGAGSVLFPPDLVEAATTSPELAGALDDQRHQFETGRQSRLGQVEILRQRIAQLRDLIRGREAQIREHDVQLRLLADETAGIQTLYEKGYAPRTRLLALQRAAAAISAERHAFEAEIARARTQIGEADLQIVQVANDHQRTVADQIRDTRSRLAELTDRRAATVEAAGREEIRAPVAGTVVALAVHTPGGVVSPGMTLMQIVPAQATALVEATVNPLDIDVVRVGEIAEVRLSGVTRRLVNTLEGHVVDVSADALADQRTGQAYYSARIEIDQGQIDRLDGVHMMAGMPVEVLIKAEDRTLAQFLLAPLHDAMFRAMRED
ncbi:HlyD family type I secretion periplasmic adaptor subunit [Zavarzinia sp. CC-PAN008]|uniref:HlyD family type I secretion periplasmic adaptor subunit n=1 Tax=Zavarzinia sp. CC-PAN008 TaxID=3243332 RepID=UPI003F746991